MLQSTSKSAIWLSFSVFHQKIYAVTLLTAQQPFRSVTTVARLLHVSSYCIRRCSSPTSALHLLLKTLVTTSSIWRMMSRFKMNNSSSAKPTTQNSKLKIQNSFNVTIKHY